MHQRYFSTPSSRTSWRGSRCFETGGALLNLIVALLVCAAILPMIVDVKDVWARLTGQRRSPEAHVSDGKSDRGGMAKQRHRPRSASIEVVSGTAAQSAPPPLTDTERDERERWLATIAPPSAQSAETGETPALPTMDTIGDHLIGGGGLVDAPVATPTPTPRR